MGALANDQGRSGTLLCSYMLSLSELPPPPKLDSSYSSKELAKRDKDDHKSGWVVVGGADAVAQVPADGDNASLDNERGDASASHEVRDAGLSRHSTPESLSTLSRSSTSSGHIQVTSSPEYEPIAVGDDGVPGSAGQQDRGDGKVDAVFKLHSSRRMKPSSTGRGVSIASRTSNLKAWELTVRTAMGTLRPPLVFESSPGLVPVWTRKPRSTCIDYNVPHTPVGLEEANHLADCGIRCWSW
jgi:phosphatidylinositol-3,4,5-trisphosphate 3-phosphatase/dual-specificity protein phosphatase PTEN